MLSEISNTHNQTIRKTEVIKTKVKLCSCPGEERRNVRLRKWDT